VQTLEPAWPFSEWSDNANKRFYIHRAAGQQVDAFRVLTGGGGRTLQANLPAHDHLERNFDRWRYVANQDYRSAFAHALNRSFDCWSAANRFERNVDTGAGSPLYNFRKAC